MTGPYLRVWAALIVLTLAEVALAWVRLPTLPTAVLLVAVSLGKAGLIAWYFMHLKSQRPPAIGALGAALALFAAALLLLLADGSRLAALRML
jgi:caa(3)-type oxidase subunit IV